MIMTVRTFVQIRTILTKKESQISLLPSIILFQGFN